MTDQEQIQRRWEEKCRKWTAFMQRAGLSPKTIPTESTYMVVATLKNWTFKNSHNYYVMADGVIPLVLAEELHQHRVAKSDIRCAGHCGCPEPATQAHWLTPAGQHIQPIAEEAKFKSLFSDHKDFNWDATVFSDDPASLGEQYIYSYHIDSELGLYLFVEFIKTHEYTVVTPMPNWL